MAGTIRFLPRLIRDLLIGRAASKVVDEKPSLMKDQRGFGVYLIEPDQLVAPRLRFGLVHVPRLRFGLVRLLAYPLGRFGGLTWQPSGLRRCQSRS
jgi:hypothetical protein